MRRAAGPLAVCALVILAGACSAQDATAYDGGGSAGDAMPPDLIDANAPTTGEESPPLPARNDDDLAAEADGSRAGRPACYGAPSACEAPACADVRSCCVGDGACCAPVARETLEGAFATGGCSANESIEACAPGALGFGAPASFAIGTVEGDIAPGGGLDSVGGVLGTERVDLILHRLRLSATFVPPDDCGAGCPESVALGVTEQTSIPGPVRPVAALVFSGSRGRMSLVIGETPVKHWNDITLAEPWVLDLRPDGTVAVERAGADSFEARYRPRQSVAPVIWGRTINPAEDLPTRLRGVTIAMSLCDVAAGWRDRMPSTVTLSGGESLRAADQVGAPSIADEVIAFSLDGAIHLARESGPRAFQAGATPTLSATPASPFLAGGVGDPELIPRGDGYTLYFTATSEAGAASIGALDLDSDLTPVGLPTEVLSAATVRASAVREPTALVHPATGEVVMLVRAEDAALHTEWLAIVRRNAGGTFAEHASPSLRMLSERGPQTAVSRFDQDETGHPSVVIHNGAWKLYYTGRRGTRESIGLFLSDDLVDWRSVGEVFPAGSAAFEAVGVGGADVAVTETGLSMAYLGSNGVYPTLAGASRIATDTGGRL